MTLIFMSHDHRSPSFYFLLLLLLLFFNFYYRLHVYMLDYLKKRGMNQTAEIFAKEARITDPRSGGNGGDGFFLSDWWAVFWDHYSSNTRAAESNAGQDIPESSAQAQAVSQTQSQAVAQVQAHAQIEIPARALTLPDNRMLGFEPYAAGSLGSIWRLAGQQYYANMLSDPFLVSTLNDDQLGVLPSYVTADFNPGCAIPSSNPRLSTDQTPRRPRRRVNRSGSRAGKTNGSDPA
ncbi:putative transcription factor interactor and regulator LisH family [Helianthus debilis subsp. tardiflorus]